MNNFFVLTSFLTLSFQALSSESVEKLPVFNKSAFKHYQMISEADDWCVPSREPKNVAKEKVAVWGGHSGHSKGSKWVSASAAFWMFARDLLFPQNQTTVTKSPSPEHWREEE